MTEHDFQMIIVALAFMCGWVIRGLPAMIRPADDDKPKCDHDPYADGRCWKCGEKVDQ